MYSVIVSVDTGTGCELQQFSSFNKLEDAYKECMELRFGGMFATIFEN